MPPRVSAPVQPCAPVRHIEILVRPLVFICRHGGLPENPRQSNPDFSRCSHPLPCPLGQASQRYARTILVSSGGFYHAGGGNRARSHPRVSRQPIRTMEIFISAVLTPSGLPAVSEMMNPEAMLVTSVAVGCLGLAVMLLTRPRTEQLAAESPENRAPAEELRSTSSSPVTESDAPAARAAVMVPAADVIASEPAKAEAAQLPSETTAGYAAARARSSSSEAAVAGLGSPTEIERAVEPAAGGVVRGPAHGASALIAKVATLLPAGTASTRSSKDAAAKPARGPAGFQPAARFSRSQQAFLRIPVVLTGRDESGREFREETCTLILLPQGAVIPMRQKVRAGARMTLSNSARQKDVTCDVFGALPGPDGRMLVEVEFPEPQKGMWPVSFPAWAGNGAGEARANDPGRAGAAARTAAPDNSGS